MRQFKDCLIVALTTILWPFESKAQTGLTQWKSSYANRNSMSNRLFIAAFSATVLSAGPLQATASGNSSAVHLRANIEPHCEIIGSNTVPWETGAQLQITTACNARNFSIGFVGSEDLDFASATGLRNVSFVQHTASHIQVQSAHPSEQVIEIGVKSPAVSLRSLQLTIRVD